MNFTILGSGGCVCLPKPLCQCRVCAEARDKGYPYARCGCSLYFEEGATVVDTPEDIAHALNNADIRRVDSILYTHWDPDHTLGMRIAEQLRLEWLDYYEGKRPEKPICVYASSGVMEDLNGIRSKYGPLLGYYEQMGLMRRAVSDVPFVLGGAEVTPIPVGKGKAVSVFVFRSGGRTLVYAPCDCKPFPDSPLFHGADVLVIGNTFVGDTLKDGRSIGQSHPLREELHSMEDVLDVKSRYGFGRVVVTHIEEDWGKSYDDYLALEGEYGVSFAYDGMRITV